MQVRNIILTSVLLGIGIILTTGIQCDSKYIGYDCNATITNTTSYSLVSVEPCKQDDDGWKYRNEIIQIVQSHVHHEIIIKSCQIIKKRQLYRCSMFEDLQLVEGGYTESRLYLSKEECYRIHDRGEYYTQKGHLVSGINKDRITSFTVNEVGYTDSKGNCEGASITSNGITYNNVISQDHYSIRIEEIIGSIDLITNIVTAGGIYAGVGKNGFGRSIDGVNLYWDPPSTDVCNPSRYSIVFEGPGVVVEMDNKSPVVVINTTDSNYAIDISKKTAFCNRKVFMSKIPNIYIYISSKHDVLAFKSDANIKLNVDLNSHILTKVAFLEYHIGYTMNKLVRMIYFDMCEINRRVYYNLLSIANFDPQEFAHNLYQSPGYYADIRGSVIYITSCKPVEITLRDTTKCYVDIPIRYNDEDKFMIPKSLIITATSAETPCTRLSPVKYTLNNRWFVTSPHVTEVSPPKTLNPNMHNNWKYQYSYTADKEGLYSRKTISDYQNYLVTRMTEDTAKKLLIQAVVGRDVDLSSIKVDKLFDNKTIGNLGLRIWFWLRTLIFTIGFWSSGILGVYIVWKLLCVIFDLICNTYTIYLRYGWNWRMTLSFSNTLTNIMTVSSERAIRFLRWLNIPRQQQDEHCQCCYCRAIAASLEDMANSERQDNH